MVYLIILAVVVTVFSLLPLVHRSSGIYVALCLILGIIVSQNSTDIVLIIKSSVPIESMYLESVTRLIIATLPALLVYLFTRKSIKGSQIPISFLVTIFATVYFSLEVVKLLPSSYAVAITKEKYYLLLLDFKAYMLFGTIIFVLLSIYLSKPAKQNDAE